MTTGSDRLEEWTRPDGIGRLLDVLERRLVQRWIGHDHTPEEARRRALGNDIPNARLVMTSSRHAAVAIAAD